MYVTYKQFSFNSNLLVSWKSVIMLSFLFYFSLVCGLHAVIYDGITGKPATQSQLRLYQERDNLE